MRRPGAASGLALLVGLAGACSPPSGAEAPVGSRAEAPEEATVSPARWLYHPRDAPSPTSALRLDDGRCLVTTEEGERWLIPTEGDRCAGEALGATFGASEPLRRIARAGDRFQFVGASGMLFEAASPLGAFDRVLPPPTALGRVASRGDVTVGLASDGSVYRLTRDGWKPADAGGARLFDVEVGEGGRALAVAWPEQILTSIDGGATFRPAPMTTPRVGALAVVFAKGTLSVAGVRGSLTWQADGNFVPSRREEARNDAGEATARPTRLSPQGAAVAQGRAALSGWRWYEARPASEFEASERGDAEGWLLVRGRLGGAFEALPLAGVPEDREVRLTGVGRTVVLAFAASEDDDDGGSANLVLRRSVDEGATFTELTRLRAPDLRRVRLAATAAGDVLVTGACPPAPKATEDPAEDKEKAAKASLRRGRRGADDRGCRPRAPVVVRARKGAPVEVVAGAANELRGLPSAPAFSPDGAIAYFLGRRAKGDQPALFVSDDGGRTFSAHPLRRRGEEDGERPRDWGRDHDEDEDEPSYEAHSELDLIDGQPLSVDGDGTVGIPVTTGVGTAWLVAESDGEVRGLASPPSDGALVTGFGRRALALELDDEDLSAWESADGGQSWAAAGTNKARLDGEIGAVCSAAGCLIGDGVTRLGWGVTATPPEVQQPRTAPRPASLLTPLACDLDPKGWITLTDVEGTTPFPTIDEIARAKSAWSLLSIDRAAGSAKVHQAAMEGTDPSRLATRALLEPAPKGKAPALRTSHQGEGYAAARHASGAAELEVAWVNFFEGTFSTRTVGLPAGAKARRSSETGPATLETGLLSVASGGIFVQPVPGVDAPAFYDARSGRSSAALPSWSQLGVSGRVRDDAARVGGTTVFVGVVDAGPMVGLLGVRGANGAMEVEATTLAPPSATGAATRVTWTYAGATPGFLVQAADASGDGWSAGLWRAFGADGHLGPVVATPTARDLPDRPRPCRADELKTTPRAEAPIAASQRGMLLARGKRHPIAVVGAAEDLPDGTLRLLTAGAVLHGTPASPCLAGWEATGLDGRRAGAVVLGDLSRAWVFRLVPGNNTSGVVNVEVRPMTCRWDPAALVPEGVWDELGVK